MILGLIGVAAIVIPYVGLLGYISWFGRCVRREYALLHSEAYPRVGFGTLVEPTNPFVTVHLPEGFRLLGYDQ